MQKFLFAKQIPLILKYISSNGVLRCASIPNRVPGQLLLDPNSNTYSKPNPNPNRGGNFPRGQLFGHPLTEAYLELSWIF